MDEVRLLMVPCPACARNVNVRMTRILRVTGLLILIDETGEYFETYEDHYEEGPEYTEHFFCVQCGMEFTQEHVIATKVEVSN